LVIDQTRLVTNPSLAGLGWVCDHPSLLAHILTIAITEYNFGAQFLQDFIVRELTFKQTIHGHSQFKLH
jgi:hypothetical protein